MYVGQFSISPDSRAGLEDIPERSVASLNTHDTPTFAGFWNGADIRDSAELGLLSESQAGDQQQYRALQRESLIRFLQSHGWLSDGNADPARVLKAWLSHIGASNVEMLLVNVEDLWLEPLPQNVPGTWEERSNWQRKAGCSLAEVRQLADVAEILKEIDRVRKEKAG
jgi:4-alpha-glucanotransferase